jgi:hypothetical protein
MRQRGRARAILINHWDQSFGAFHVICVRLAQGFVQRAFLDFNPVQECEEDGNDDDERRGPIPDAQADSQIQHKYACIARMANKTIRAGIDYAMVPGNGHAGREKTPEIKDGIETEDKPQHIEAKTGDTNRLQRGEEEVSMIGNLDAKAHAHNLHRYDHNGRASIFGCMAPPGTPRKQAFTAEPNNEEDYDESRSHSDVAAVFLVLASFSLQMLLRELCELTPILVSFGLIFDRWPRGKR